MDRKMGLKRRTVEIVKKGVKSRIQTLVESATALNATAKGALK